MHPEDPRPVAPERSITIAFDGACKGNPGPGGYAAILVNDHTQAETIVRGGEPQTTNNRMELRAAIEALNPRARSSGAPDPRGPQSLAAPTALLDSAGRSGLLRCATAYPPHAAGRLDSGDGRLSECPARRGLGKEP